MDLKESVKPITYLKNRTADLVREVSEDGTPVIITQNGEAKVVVLDIDTYGRWRDALALLKIVAQAEADVEAGRTVTQREALARAERTLERARLSRDD